MSPQGIKTYQKNIFKTTADNRKVVAMLYEGVVQSLYIAISAIEAGDRKTRTEKIDKALQIIHFMSVALDFEQGGEIAANLSKLYDYCRDAITTGNIKGDVAKIREVITLFNVVLEGWKQIGDSPLDAEDGVKTPVPTDENVEVSSTRKNDVAPALSVEDVQVSGAPPSPSSGNGTAPLNGNGYGKINGYARSNGVMPRSPMGKYGEGPKNGAAHPAQPSGSKESVIG